MNLKIEKNRIQTLYKNPRRKRKRRRKTKETLEKERTK